jgi:riboflavin synthase
MFTGIITTTGQVRHLGQKLMKIASEPIARELDVGGSVAVSGACLTAVSVDRAAGEFEVELSPETLSRTKLGSLKAGEQVNLELPLRLSDRLGGHLVQGHVDTVGEVVSIEPQGEFQLFTFRVDPGYDHLIVEKGSIAVDGVSLTPFNVDAGRFDVAIIPHTLRVTTLGLLRSGDKVNIEFDLMAKYVEKMLRPLREGVHG